MLVQKVYTTTYTFIYDNFAMDIFYVLDVYFVFNNIRIIDDQRNNKLEIIEYIIGDGMGGV